MRQNRRMLAAALLLIAPQVASAQAPEWRRPDTDGKFYWVLVDAKSIKPDAAKGWTRFTYAHAGGPNYRSLTPLGASSQGAFDCKTGQFHAFRNNKWEPGSKGHMDGPVRAFVCKR
jgi:hypothetical protein